MTITCPKCGRQFSHDHGDGRAICPGCLALLIVIAGEAELVP